MVGFRDKVSTFVPPWLPSLESPFVPPRSASEEQRFVHCGLGTCPLTDCPMQGGCTHGRKFWGGRRVLDCCSSVGEPLEGTSCWEVEPEGETSKTVLKSWRNVVLPCGPGKCRMKLPGEAAMEEWMLKEEDLGRLLSSGTR